MPPPRKSVRGTAPTAPSRASRPGRALVLIDASKLRRATRKRYEIERRKLDQARGELERFHAQDEPAYVRWVNLKFGPLLGELRELLQRIQATAAQIERIESIARHYRVSPAQAFRISELAQQAPPNPDAEPPDTTSESTSRPRDETWHDDDPDPEAPPPLDELFEDLTRMMLGHPPLDEKRLKEIYRKLARKLHPDAGAVMSEETRLFWQRAQEAYEHRDLDGLELVLQMVEDKEEAVRAQASIGALRKLIQGIQKALRSIRRELAECRRTPAWNCAKTPPDPFHESVVRIGLSADRDRARAELEELEATLARWANPPPIQRARRPRRPDRRTPLRPPKPPWDDIEAPF